MWPWEHLAVGYLLYSLGARAAGEPPTDAAAVAVAVATLLPDLVDKPLSWGLGLFPTGYAVGHSVFVAAPVGVLVLWRRRGRPWAVAAVVGYWSHLLADVLDPLRRGDAPLPGRVLWPVVTGTPYEADYGLGRGLLYVDAYVAALLASPSPAVIGLSVALPAATVSLWVLDGRPGAAPAVAWLRRRRRRQ